MFTPGPGIIIFIYLGAYNPDYRIMIKALPLYTMGSKVLSSSSKMQPGPGAYESKSTVMGVPCMK